MNTALAAALAGVLGHAKRQVERAQEDGPTAVHEYRKAVRRARALLALLTPTIGDPTWARRMRKTLRDVHRSTSAWRDADVLGAALGLLPKDESLAALWALVGDALAQDPSVAPDADGPARLLADGAARFASLPGELRSALEDLAPSVLTTGLAQTYARAQARRAKAARTGNASDVHDWRKRTKELAYQLELVAHDERADSLRKDAARIAKRLGEITDLHVVEERVRKEDALAPGERRAAIAILDAEQQRRRLAALAKTEAWFAPTPEEWSASIARVATQSERTTKKPARTSARAHVATQSERTTKKPARTSARARRRVRPVG